MTHRVRRLGSNLAHPRRQLARAVRAIGRLPRMSVIAVSPAYATAPIGCESPQPDYVNAVIAVSTTLAPRALLHALHSIERRARRRRDLEHKRNAARTLDLDLLPLRTPPRARAGTRGAAPAHAPAGVRAPSSVDIAAATTIPGRGSRGLSAWRARPAHRAHPVALLSLAPRGGNLRWISSGCRYVVVEGPIGAGKTSLARVLARHVDGEELFERPEDNPFLERFYGDMPRFASRPSSRSCSSAPTSCQASASSTCSAASRSAISCSTRIRCSRGSTCPMPSTVSTRRSIRT
jgi:2-amino-4-hydroxy-6-hydroxymethyldihydropteridine diphosphokinase